MWLKQCVRVTSVSEIVTLIITSQLTDKTGIALIHGIALGLHNLQSHLHK